VSGEGPTRYRYVAVEGVIGVGKTTLVHRLAQRLDARIVLEEFEENPFLPDFYRDRRAYALSTQLFFLMSRYRQQEVLAQGELFRSRTIADYFFDKDRIFAILTLESHELAVYERLFEVLQPQVPRPDLVIYLKADLEVVLSRIAARDRAYERGMDPGYMRDLSSAYTDFFRGYRGAPVLTLDTSGVDFRSEAGLFDQVVQLIAAGQPPSVMAAQLPNAAPLLPGFA
jgi:deoxyguanosine kinase